MRRRTFLRRAAVGGTALLGGVASAAATTGASRSKSEHVGSVTTRGHFDIEWNADFWDDGVREVVLEDGHSKYGYETWGTIPGMNAPAPDDLVLVAHGWNAEGAEAELTFHTAAGGLNTEDVAAPIVGFEYDADTLPTDWWEATELAKRNGYKAASFLADYRDANPDVTVRLWGHSLGGQVLASTIRVLDAAGRHDVVDSASAFGAAVNDEDFAADGAYGGPFERAAGEVHNYHSERDDVLRFGYSPAELSAAAGLVGADGETTDNYTDHDVTDRVSTHLSYFDPDDAGEGCAPIVAAEW